jgi:hypothetical protein
MGWPSRSPGAHFGAYSHTVRQDRFYCGSDESINLKFEKIPRGRGSYNRWTINGKSWPDTNPLFTVQRGKRYRLVLDNNSGDERSSTCIDTASITEADALDRATVEENELQDVAAV